MSFSFSFLAANKAHAHAHLAQANVPIEMQRLCRGAVDNIRGDGPISVSAHGHICQNGGDYEVTTVTLEVKPMRVTNVDAKATDNEAQRR